MELGEGSAALEEEDGNSTKSDLGRAEPLSCSETSGSRAKDRCDSLLDAIDAQLSRLQWQGPGAGGTNGDPSLECYPNGSWIAEMEGCCASQAGTSWGKANPSREEECGWRLRHLLGLEPAPENLGDQSDSSSVCTEDFAARFREGMVEPLGNSDGEGDVPAGDFPSRHSAEEGCVTGITAPSTGLPPAGEPCEAAAEDFPLSTERSRHVLNLSEEGREGDLSLALASRVEGPQSLSSRARRESLESLGGRISRLSQGDARDTPGSTDLGRADSAGSQAPGLAPPEWAETWEENLPWPLQQGGQGLGGSSRRVQDSRELSRPFSGPVLGEGLDPSRPLRASESQSVRTAPSPSGGRQPPGHSTQGPRCPRRDSLGCLGSSRAVTEEEEEEEEESLWSPGSAEWRSSSPVRCSSVLSRAEPREEACPEPKVQSALHQERRKWAAEKREELQVQRGTLEEQSQRAHAEALDKERRTGSVLQNKTLELQKRIRALELHGRSLQREKQEALDELWRLLQEEKTEALRRLQEEMEQERACESDRLRATLQQLEEEQSLLRAEQSEMSIRAREAQSRAQRAERALAGEIGLACQGLWDLLPERARGWMAHGSPAPPSISRALQLLRGASEETRRYLGASQQALEAQKRAALPFQQEKEQLQGGASLQLKAAGGGEQRTLRQPLREKDPELQARPRGMAHWTDRAACRLAGKCEEELTAELETCFSRDRPRGDVERRAAAIGRLSTAKDEHAPLAKDWSERARLRPTQLSSFLRLELLCRLQGRMRELRAENPLYPGGSREDLAALRVEPGQVGSEEETGPRAPRSLARGTGCELQAVTAWFSCPGSLQP